MDMNGAATSSTHTRNTHRHSLPIYGLALKADGFSKFFFAHSKRDDANTPVGV